MKRESNLTSNRMETLSKYFPAGRLLATLFVGMLFLLVSAQPATTSDTELQDTPQEVVLTGDEDKDAPPPPAGARQMSIRVFLQGYYVNQGEKKLRRARGEGGSPYFSLSNVSDRVTIRLHEVGDYNNVLQMVENVYLFTSGYVVNFPIKDEIDEPVWVSVSHRNHLETVYFEPINLSGLGTNLYELDFTTAADRAYGSNQAHLGGGVYGIYAGDVDQDGVLSVLDLSDATDAVRAGVNGYVVTDVDGDGVSTVLDLSLATDNVRLGVTKRIPSND